MGGGSWCFGFVFFCESGLMLAQVARGGCGVSVFGDTQNLTGHGPAQPALGEPGFEQET